jgi:hypothetical protein
MLDNTNLSNLDQTPVEVNPRDDINSGFYERYQKIDKETNTRVSLDLKFETMSLLDFEKKYNIPEEYSTLVTIFSLYFRVRYTTGPWIAGGLYRRALQGEKFENFSGDVDLFFNSKDQIEDFSKALFSGSFDIKNPVFLKGSEFSQSFSAEIMGKKFTIQCINYKLFTSAQELLNQFDLFSCMFATDGVTMTYERNLAVHAAKNKFLKYNWQYVDNKGYTMMFMSRFKKFLKEGYDIGRIELKNVTRLIQEMNKVGSSADYLDIDYGRLNNAKEKLALEKEFSNLADDLPF